LGPAGYREMALAGAVSGHSQVRVTSQVEVVLQFWSYK
jgi:hypothetical protein